LNLEYGPGFSVRGMRVDQVTGQLTVGQLASRTGVRADTVRYYEREGLLPVPQRTEREHRRYGRDDVDRLLFIRGAQRLGVRLAEIRELLAIRDTGVCACEPAEGCCGATSPRSRWRWSGWRRCGPGYSACWRLCRVSTAPTRCPGPGGRPAFHNREGGDGDVPMLRRLHLRRLMLRRGMLLS